MRGTISAGWVGIDGTVVDVVDGVVHGWSSVHTTIADGVVPTDCEAVVASPSDCIGLHALKPNPNNNNIKKIVFSFGITCLLSVTPIVIQILIPTKSFRNCSTKSDQSKINTIEFNSIVLSD